MLDTLAHELGKLPNKLAFEGHTDSKQYSSSGNYGNWELSADRANAEHRLMVQNDVRPDQITQVRGFADQHLRKADNPLDPANRRISLIVRYQEKKAPAEGAAGESGEGEQKSGEHKTAEGKSAEGKEERAVRPPSGATKPAENSHRE
jgi:chemotaxis protein MotB